MKKGYLTKSRSTALGSGPPQMNIMMLLFMLAVIMVLNMAGCAPAVYDRQSEPEAETQKPAGATVPGSGEQSIGENERVQMALDLLFTWQPEWREMSEQGKRAIAGGFATLVIELAEESQPGIYLFHVYDGIEYPEGKHSCTIGWFEVDCNRGVIYDQILNEKVY